jgi:hypothetical protein
MFKLIFFLWRRQDFDRAAFIDLYDPGLVKVALNGSFC